MSTRPFRLRTFEALEPRHLLDGTILVNLVAGNLFILGDEHDNVVSVEQTTDESGRTSLAIIPDRDTSINRLAPGEPLFLGDVLLRSVRIAPGDGADNVRVSGLTVVGGLEFRDSGGPSTLIVEQANLRGDLDVRSTAPLDVTVAELAARGGYLKIEGVAGESRSSVHLDNLDLAGNLRVTSIGSPLDLSASSITARGGYLKIDGVDGESRSSVHLDKLDLSGGLRVTSSGSPLDLRGSHSTARGGGYLKIDGIDGESSDRAHKSEIDILSWSWGHGLRVESTHPLNLTTRDTTAAAYDVFLKIEGIKGEAEDSRSSVVLDNLHVSRDLRVTSSGSPLDLSASSTTARGIFLKIDGVAGESRSSVQLDKLDLSGGLRVTSSGSPLDLRASYSTARGGGYLKIDGIDGESSDRAHKSEIDILSWSWGHGLRVESTHPLNLTTRDTTAAAYDVFLKIEGIKGEAEDSRSSVVLDNLHVSRDLRVTSSGSPLNLSASSTTARGAFLKLGDVKGEFTGTSDGGESGATVSIIASEFRGGLMIVGGNGSDSVHLERLRVHGRTDVRLHGGDDLLTVIDALFAKPVRFDGGAGDDTLRLVNVEFLHDAVLRNWETILRDEDSRDDNDDDEEESERGASRLFASGPRSAVWGAVGGTLGRGR